ncbi:MAG: hypothetical protein QM640_05860 [Niabella sp.]
MKLLKVFFVCSLLCCCSCGLNQREKVLKEKEAELGQQQQKLLLWEQQLAEKEKLLSEREHRLDSTKMGIDSVVIHGPSIIGRWQVKMQCVETSCDGSAIGDIKNEQWEFAQANNAVVVKAYSGKNLIRIYNGTYTQSGMQLVDQSSQSAAQMEVTLRILNEKKLDGIREITLPNCKTTYSISADRL